MENNKYYFQNTIVETEFPTLWDGYLTYEADKLIEISDNYFQKSNRELDDLLQEICDIHFYVSLIDNTIYLSICRDSHFYYQDFEKNIKKIIKEIEIKFNISIKSGQFNANEVKHGGSQYKYTINKDNDKISVKRKILNWETYDDKVVKKMKDLKI